MRLIVAAVTLLLSLRALADGEVHPIQLGVAGGRFVFGQINGMARDQYMLDTQSGQLWQLVCVKSDPEGDNKCLRQGLQEVRYLEPFSTRQSALPFKPSPPRPPPEDTRSAEVPGADVQTNLAAWAARVTECIAKKCQRDTKCQTRLRNEAAQASNEDWLAANCTQ